MPASSAEQLALFESHPSRNWGDLRPDYERRRDGVISILGIAREILPEAERRAAARRLGVEYSLDGSFLRSYPGYLVHQHCLFHTRLQGIPLLEHCIREAPEVEDDVSEALRRAYAAVIRIPRVSKVGAFVATDLLTGERRVVLEDAAFKRRLSGNVIFTALIPFRDYALMLGVPVRFGATAWTRLNARLSDVARSLGAERAALASEHPRAFEIACIRAWNGQPGSPLERDLTLRALSYRHGFDAGDGSLMPDEPDQFLDLTAEELPIDLIEAFDFEGIGLLEGDFGNKDLGTPRELDDLRFETGMGSRRIRVYNRHMAASESSEMTRIHAFLSRLGRHASPDGPVEEPDGWPRALNWTSVSALYGRRSALMKRVADECMVRAGKADMRAVARRLGVTLGDIATSEERALLFEAYLFARPEKADGPLEAFAKRKSFPRDSEELLVLDRMIGSEASLWGVTKVFPGHGLEVLDLWDEEGKQVMLIDDRAGATFSGRYPLFGRLALFEGFALAAGALIPMSPAALDGFSDRLESRGGKEIPQDEFAELCTAAYLEAARGEAGPAPGMLHTLPAAAPAASRTRLVVRPHHATAAPTASALRAAPAISEKSPRNAPCPCGSGRKYKHCCAGAR